LAFSQAAQDRLASQPFKKKMKNCRETREEIRVRVSKRERREMMQKR
jgi:hypothetical protein